MEPEQQEPVTVWFGGIETQQDVSIRLVPNGINQRQVTNLGSREPVAVLKVHSTRLKKYSKFFRVCFSTRWTNPDAQHSIEFSLELIEQVPTYTECFSRMYTPLRKNFKDVKSTLELLRVASQIEFLELVDSICVYLSTILWSEEDELRIRQFSSTADFPRGQAEDLVARLQIGEHGSEETYHKKSLCHLIAHCIRIALRQHGNGQKESFRSAQHLFEDLFSSFQQSEVDSAFQSDVVKIVNDEVKGMLESFQEDCRTQARFSSPSLQQKWVEIDGGRVSGFEGKLEALCWVLELLLKTQVAEEVIKCLLHLNLFFAIVAAADALGSTKPASDRLTVRFAKLVILIFREVVTGSLLLRTPDRVLLFQSWKTLHLYHEPSLHNDILVTWGFGQAVEDLFLTLPLEQQMEILQQSRFTFPGFMCRCSLINLMKRNWPAEGLDALLHSSDMETDAQAEGDVSRWNRQLAFFQFDETSCAYCKSVL